VVAGAHAEQPALFPSLSARRQWRIESLQLTRKLGHAPKSAMRPLRTVSSGAIPNGIRQAENRAPLEVRRELEPSPEGA